MTDSEIITRLATGIHGWKEHPSHAQGAFVYVEDAGRRCTRFNFNPLESWGDVMEIVEVIRKKYCFQLDTVGFTGNEWRCQIGWSDDPVSVAAEAPTGQRAICIAVLKMIAVLEGK